ncbi:MAG: hypothetical protein IKA42_05750, partial [Clostridia bacterium]|nr:hypothetical protein [Clostridia bacterium]
RLKKYINSNDKVVEYTSRFYNHDYINMAFTLSVLEDKDYNKSLLEFLKKVLITIKNVNKEKKISETKGIAMALYLLTYSGLLIDIKEQGDIDKQNFEGANKQKKIEDIEKWLFSGILEKRKNNLKFCLKEENFYITYERFYGKLNHQFNNMKRVWCALRDYIKDEKYSVCFFKEVFDMNLPEKEQIDKLAKDLELPGDVWNNNSAFAGCVFGEELANDEVLGRYYDKFKTKQYIESKKLLRMFSDECKEILSEEIKDKLYPEIFDCTFDFVPRMCVSNGKCEICPFGKVSKDEEKGAKFDDLCTCVEGKLCPVAMVCCGYKYYCPGENCLLKQTVGVKN